ncbi:YVTN family beta-propeller repeat protein [Marinivivus vitaminiproducens]|uniref:YVTN family beta-propeller repeat protein n=1 Tax=Marinivivus vitaminiproducens TaxID=3035935 RepID=UPI0027A3B5F4|nr:hypothetical protein P4R82_15680 [Geminicoccaceae bacterium SCSIO 64248]
MTSPGSLPRRDVLALLGVSFAAAACAPDRAVMPSDIPLPPLAISLERANQVAFLDPVTRDVIDRVGTAERPRDMHLSADGSELLVACASGRIDRIDLEDRAIRRSLALDFTPQSFVVRGDNLYVVDGDSSDLVAIDLEGNRPLWRTPVGESAEGLADSADGRHLFATAEADGAVHVVAAASGEPVRTTAIGAGPRRAVRAGDGRIWVSAGGGGAVYVIDPVTDRVDVVLPVTPEGVSPEDANPVGIAFSPDGTRALVALGRAGRVAAVDVRTLAVLRYIPVGERPWGVVVDQTGDFGYVANGRSNDLTVIDMNSLEAITAVPVGDGPHTVLFTG